MKYCKNGHPMTLENTVVRRDRLICRTCEREANRRSRELKREAEKRAIEELDKVEGV